MIYLIRNNINEECYVGYTSKSLDERFAKHIQNAKGGSNTYLYNAMRKYGFENFTIECLQENGNISEDEPLWIKKIEPQYNMTNGGEGGNTSDSPNYKIAMENRRSYKGKGNPNYGKRGADSPKSQKVKVDGIIYGSITEARKYAKRSFNYVKKYGQFL